MSSSATQLAASLQLANNHLSPSLTQFAQAVGQECLQGSAIHADLFNACVDIIQDVETQTGGEVNYPIHEALNWRVTRFGQQVRQTQFAALFINEDGSCWQAKLKEPIWDKDKQKHRKYETPVNAGARAYFPPIPTTIRHQIAARYNIAVPEQGNFWSWLKTASIPIIITEGAKKALALLSQGYVAIALYGVNGGYRSKDNLGNPCVPYLIPDLAPLIQPGRSVFLAFDQDAAATTKQKVNVALARFGKLITQAEATVKIIQWDGAIGKGADDLIVNGGAALFDLAYDSAVTIDEWRILLHLSKQLTLRPAQIVNTADLSQAQLCGGPKWLDKI